MERFTRNLSEQVLITMSDIEKCVSQLTWVKIYRYIEISRDITRGDKGTNNE